MAQTTHNIKYDVEEHSEETIYDLELGEAAIVAIPSGRYCLLAIMGNKEVIFFRETGEVTYTPIDNGLSGFPLFDV